MNASPQDSEYGNPEIFYNKFYNQMICGASNGGGIGTKATSSTHRKMEKNLKGRHFSDVLELGGGNGEHLDFVSHGFDRYTLVDIRPTDLPKKWSQDSRIVSLIANAEHLPFEDNSIDRVVVPCLLHHVDHPELVLNEINRVLKDAGEATIFLTCDPGLAVRVLRRITTRRIAKRLGFHGYDLMIAREHRNHVGSLLQMTRYVFRNRRIQENWQPFHLPSWNLNGYVVLTITK